MFNKVKKRVGATINDNNIETILGCNTFLKGQITGTGNVRVDGHIEGGIAIDGNVVIGESGIVTGDIKAQSMMVSGKVTGNAALTGCLVIHATGQLSGDINVAALKMEDGGVFQGRSDMPLREAAADIQATE